MTLALIRRNDSALSITLTEHALALIESAMGESALIGRVSDADGNAAAVAAQQALKAAENAIEKAREEAKRPILEYGRTLDAAVKKALEPLRREQIRVATEVGNYQTEQLAKQRAEEARQKAELAEVERKRQAELARAQTHEQRDQINSRMDEEAKVVAPPIQKVRSEGQIVKEEWEIEEINMWVLARARPELVTEIKFDRVGIKSLLNAGMKLPGVKAKQVVNATVRVPRTAMIEV